MDQTYNPHDGGHNFGKGHGSVIASTDTGEITIRVSFVRMGGCKILIKESWDENPIATYTLTLCDIDPMSIKITTALAVRKPSSRFYDLNCDCDSAGSIEFLTTDGAPVITEEEMGINEEDLRSRAQEMRPEKRTSKTNKAALLVDDAAYAQRLAKALKRAVELCGGKRSKFWPPNWKSKITD
jgi:hypothetical protein